MNIFQSYLFVQIFRLKYGKSISLVFHWVCLRYFISRDCTEPTFADGGQPPPVAKHKGTIFYNILVIFKNVINMVIVITAIVLILINILIMIVVSSEIIWSIIKSTSIISIIIIISIIKLEGSVTVQVGNRSRSLAASIKLPHPPLCLSIHPSKNPPLSIHPSFHKNIHKLFLLLWCTVDSFR